MNRTALFPGSFDPFTAGHRDIVDRVLRLFDRVVVAVGVNSDKQYMFTADERVQAIAALYAGEPRLRVVEYTGMTVDLCRQVGASCIVRGVRNARDLEYEQTVAAVNHAAAPDIETVILLADDRLRDISSTLERERLRHLS